jgi:PKD domain
MRGDMTRAQDARPAASGALFQVRAGTVLLATSALVVLLLGGVGPTPGSHPLGSALAPPVARALSAGFVTHTATSAWAASHPLASITLNDCGRSPATICLNWTATTDLFFSNYTVSYSASGASGPFEVTGVLVSQSTTTFSRTGLAPGGTYWWQVIEYGSLGNSGSNVLTVIQPTLAFLNYTTPSGTTAKFTWTNNASYGGSIGFVDYGLYDSVSGGAPSRIASFTNAGLRTYTLSGLSAGTSYSFYLNTTDCYSGCGASNVNLSVTTSDTTTFGTALALVASVSANRPAVDAGELDYFICTPSGGTSPFTFAWNFGSGTFVNASSSVSRSFATPGSATVTCKITDAAMTTSTAATTVTVAADPTLTLTTNRSAVDVGQAIGFVCTVAQGTPPYSILWTFGDGTQVSGGVQTHSYTAAGQYSATCSATDATATPVAQSLSIPVSLALRVTVTSSSAAAAPGTPLMFTALPVNGSGSYTTYTWTFGDGASASTRVASHAYLASGAFTARLNVTDSNGAVAIAASPEAISPIRIVVASLTGSPTTATRLTFNASASGGAGGPFNFTWTFGDGTRAYGPETTHTYGKSGTYHPQLVVADRLGATNNTTLSPLAIGTPPGPFAWVSSSVLIGLGIIAGLLVAIVASWVYRRRESAAYRGLEGRFPVVDPAKTVSGAKVCPRCGTTNLPIRTTCAACGATLRRSLFE